MAYPAALSPAATSCGVENTKAGYSRPGWAQKDSARSRFIARRPFPSPVPVESGQSTESRGRTVRTTHTCSRKCGSDSLLSGIECRVSTRSEILLELRSRQPKTAEEFALKLLALRAETPDPTWLIQSQRRDGAWSAFPSAGPPNVFHTALALIALRHVRAGAAQTGRGLAWLESISGSESHWLWKWKFRLFDKQVRFDPDKSGWPWVPGTVSWVAPTALAVLAFEAWARKSPRVDLARAMLLDRACPGGGWNAGNGVAFGVALDPHPDFTAMALLALREPCAQVRGGAEYLLRRAPSLRSSYSLAWCAMALNQEPVVSALRASLNDVDRQPTYVLALAAVALEVPPFQFKEVHQ